MEKDYQGNLITGSSRFKFNYAKVVSDVGGFFVEGGNQRNAYFGPIMPTAKEAIAAARGLTGVQRIVLAEKGHC